MMSHFENEVFNYHYPIRSKEDFLHALSVLIGVLPNVIAEEQIAPPYGGVYNIDLITFLEAMDRYIDDAVIDEREMLSWKDVFGFIFASIIYE